MDTATLPGTERERTYRPAPVLVIGAVLLAVAAGGLLWWRNGDAVFTQYLTSALAWCF